MSVDPSSTSTTDKSGGNRSPVTATTGTADVPTTTTGAPALAQPGDWWRQFLQGAPASPSSTAGAPATQNGAEAALPAADGPRHSKAPLIAGTVAAFAVLVFGLAVVWWRNRASRYWPA
jgi:hypothetical protein